jgi:putative addiction module component (TIGR02574 family)
MSGTPLETLQRRMAFARSYDTRSMLLPRIQALLGPAMEVGLGGTSSHDFPSAWCTCSAVTKSKSSPWLTAGAGRATGGRDSDTSNNPLQRTRLRRPQRAELDRRLDDLEREGPVGIPWDEVLSRIRSRGR